MEPLRLFMAVIGCRPPGRFTEQHDVFFGIGTSIKALVPEMKAFWPEAGGKIHVDAWREVSCVNGHCIRIVPAMGITEANHPEAPALFFLNLGGYKPGEFEEFHYKLLVVADSMAAAVAQARGTAFYKHTGFKGAVSHIDDKYGIDVDDAYAVKDILPPGVKQKFRLFVEEQTEPGMPEDTLHIGYFKLDKL